MAKTADAASLKRMIEESNILTGAERTYWTESLLKMTPEQMERLRDILTRARNIPWTEQIQSYFLLIAKSAKAA